MRISFRWRAALGALAVAAIVAPASAVVGGREGGSLAGSTLMLLNSRGGVCTGIVLSPRAILTAAHCLDGGVDLRIHWRDGDGQPVLLEPASVSRHPEFRADAVSSRRRSIDLALVRTREPLPSRFGAATLIDGSAPRAGSTVELAGYGVAREGDSRSTGTYRAATLSVVEPYGPGRLLLWASDPAGGGKRPGAGACQGDSGGPLSIGDDAVIAVTSWSTGPAAKRCGLLTQGVLVGPQRGWIDGALQGWGERARWTTGR